MTHPAKRKGDRPLTFGGSQMSADPADVNTAETALRQIAHVLGAASDPEPRDWKCGNNCEGCRHEMAEASALALNALGFSTYKELLDAG